MGLFGVCVSFEIGLGCLWLVAWFGCLLLMLDDLMVLAYMFGIEVLGYVGFCCGFWLIYIDCDFGVCWFSLFVSGLIDLFVLDCVVL